MFEELIELIYLKGEDSNISMNVTFAAIEAGLIDENLSHLFKNSDLIKRYSNYISELIERESEIALSYWTCINSYET